MEAQHFNTRKNVLEYDDVMNQQREVIYSLRREAILDDPEELLEEFRDDLLEDIFMQIPSREDRVDEETRSAVMAELEEAVNLSRFWDTGKGIPQREDVEAGLNQVFAELKEAAGPAYLDVLRYFILEELDRCWKEHLVDMDHLRDGIGLRGYGQRDPKQEYKREGFEMFKDMLGRIKLSTFKMLTRLRLRRVEEEMPEPYSPAPEAPSPFSEQDRAATLGFRHRAQPTAMSYSGPSESGGAKVTRTSVKRAEPRVGRNDPCPCGSGKKYKKCCGA